MNNEQNQTITSDATLRYADFGVRLGAILLDALALFGIAFVIYFISIIISVAIRMATGSDAVISKISILISLLIIY